MSLTYTTIEKIVLDAVRGRPTTSQSRTDHLRVRARAQTPRLGEKSDSSLDCASDSEFSGRSYPEQGLEGVTSCEESDGTTEMCRRVRTNLQQSLPMRWDPQGSLVKTTPYERFVSRLRSRSPRKSLLLRK